MLNVAESPQHTTSVASLLRGELDALVSYAIHLSGDPNAATEEVVAGIHHALRFPPAQWTDGSRAILYRAVTRACKQHERFPAQPAGLGKLFKRAQAPYFVDVDTTGAGRVNTVKRAIATMPFERRAALLLRDHAGLNYRELSTVLECSPQMAARTVATARREFGAIFKEIAL